MKYKKIVLSLLVTIVFALSGCDKKEDVKSEFQTITGREAMDIINEGGNIVILDVRTEEEYSVSHIENSILLPHDEILEKAEDVLVDKDATILIYCRSGRRSALAAQDLIDLGYKSVYDFGGIIDWPYDTVTD